MYALKQKCNFVDKRDLLEVKVVPSGGHDTGRQPPARSSVWRFGSAAVLGRDVVPNEPSGRGVLRSSFAVSCSPCRCLGREGSTSLSGYLEPRPQPLAAALGIAPCAFPAVHMLQTKSAFLGSGSW